MFVIYHFQKNVEENSILVSVWLPWSVPRLHIAWVQVTTGLGFFSAFMSFEYNCEDSDSLLYKA